MMPTVPDKTFRLDDGRVLGFRVWGDPAGLPLLFLHGTPGSRLKFSIGHELGQTLGLAIVAPDRWGYGLTDAPPVPTLAGFARDMAHLMDHLGYRTFAVGGISGGGPYAAAVAACLEARATRVALISPVGPIADSACWAEMQRFQRFCFGSLWRMPWATAGAFGVFRWTLRRAPSVAAHLATLRGGAADKAIIARPQTQERLLRSFAEGLRPGMRGPVIDIDLFSKPWGFEPASIRAPTRLWLGSDDNAVPLAAARALALQIAGCELIEMGGQGHLWVAAHYPEVLEWVRSDTGQSTAMEAEKIERRSA